ncbi:hypothetical protein HDU92_002589 [Lobulomyces angularis]|nr:hypothetical protein HDU92_002589 [Lobulomyces angularis]
MTKKLMMIIILTILKLVISLKTNSNSSSNGTTTTGLWFDRIILTIFENTNYADAIANRDFKNFANSGRLLNNTFALTHPSQPNYISLVSGSKNHLNVIGSEDANLREKSVADSLETAGISWAAYNEGYPSNQCFTGTKTGAYYRKHNPFISFTSINQNRTRCLKRIKPGSSFVTDMNSQVLPKFIFYTPDNNNNAHDTTTSYAGKYLTRTLIPRFNKILANRNERNLFVVLFDEDIGGDNNRIYAVLYGTGIGAAEIDSKFYDHFSFLKTVQQNWNLPSLADGDSEAYSY